MTVPELGAVVPLVGSDDGAVPDLGVVVVVADVRPARGGDDESPKTSARSPPIRIRIAAPPIYRHASRRKAGRDVLARLLDSRGVT